MQKIMFAQFVKVNEATGEFTGIAAEEIPTRPGRSSTMRPPSP